MLTLPSPGYIMPCLCVTIRPN